MTSSSSSSELFHRLIQSCSRKKFLEKLDCVVWNSILRLLNLKKHGNNFSMSMDCRETKWLFQYYWTSNISAFFNSFVVCCTYLICVGAWLLMVTQISNWCISFYLTRTG
uniref:Transmembrane protein n=1 Tax=Kalanchoe fedtschenkoi TaxID=63787 RepID=A0A7N0TN42_KALFE